MAGNEVKNSLESRDNLADPLCIFRALEIHIGPSAAASMLLHVAVAPHGKSFSEWNSPALADLLEVPAQRLGVHSMVGSEQEGRVRSRAHCLPDEIVHAGQVLLRFGRLRRPRVH